MSFTGFQPLAGTPLSFLEAFSAVLEQYRRRASVLLPAVILCSAPLTVISIYTSWAMGDSAQAMATGTGLASMGGSVLMLVFLGMLSRALVGSLCLSVFSGGDDEPRLGSVIQAGFAGLGRSLVLVIAVSLVGFLVVFIYVMLIVILALMSKLVGILAGVGLGLFLLLFLGQLALVPAVGLFRGLGFGAAFSRTTTLLKGATGRSLALLAVFAFMAFVLLLFLQWPVTMTYMKQILANVLSGGSDMPQFHPVGWQKAWMLGVGIVSPAITAIVWLACGVQVISLEARETQAAGQEEPLD